MTGLLIVACFILSNVASVLDAQNTLPNAPTGFVQRISTIGGRTLATLVALHFVRENGWEIVARSVAAARRLGQEFERIN